MLQPCKKLHVFNDERGTLAFIAIAGALPLFLIVFLIVNSGKATFDGTRTQDAADMIAMAHATEAARALNTISMNQVSIAQNYTTAVHSSSLYNTISIHIAMTSLAAAEAAMYANNECNHWLSIPYIGAALKAICMVPATLYGAELLAESAATAQLHWRYEPRKALQIASKALETLDNQNRAIVDRFPDVIRQQGNLIADTHRVSGFYIDDTCQEGLAASCSASALRQGMDLPVSVNTPRAIFPTFCMALHFGTGGIDTGKAPVIGELASQLGGFSQVSAVHGSFQRRGFPINSGPMYGGSHDDPYLPIHVSKTSTIGTKLEYYQDISKEIRLYDGVLNAAPSAGQALATVARMAGRAALGLSTRKYERRMERHLNQVTKNPLGFLIIGGYSTNSYRGGPGESYPFDQTEDKNVFTMMTELRVAAKCSGIGEASKLAGSIIGKIATFTGLLTQVPDFDLYHPRSIRDESWLPRPTVLPGLDDFHNDYQPLAFALRLPNQRWANTYFRVHPQGYLKYAQAITYNPEEISLYSQSWRARLVPAHKLRDLSTVVSNMKNNLPPRFSPYETLMGKMSPHYEGWPDAVSR